MCFFKVKTPSQATPNVAAQLPSIRETKAPEPESPLFGGGADALATSGEMGTNGIRGLKIPKLEQPAGLKSATGTSKSGFNVQR